MVCPYTECPFNSNDSCSAHRNQPQLTYNEAVNLLDRCENPNVSRLINMFFVILVVIHYNELRKVSGLYPFLHTEREIVEYMINQRSESGEDIVLPHSELLTSITNGTEVVFRD